VARRRRAPTPRSTAASELLEPPDGTVLDLLDRLLNKGVNLTGDVTLGVAGVDLVYLRLSALLCAVDRIGVGPRGERRGPTPTRRRRRPRRALLAPRGRP